MNSSVKLYAAKDRTYSKSNSLDAHVAIAARCQVLGYVDYWSRICHSFSIPLDDQLIHALKQKDRATLLRTKLQSSKPGKRPRRKNKFSKYKTAQREYIKQQRTGDCYQSSIALAETKKVVMASPSVSDSNLPGTTKDKIRCMYHHPNYCVLLGHTDTRSTGYYSHKLTLQKDKNTQYYSQRGCR